MPLSEKELKHCAEQLEDQGFVVVPGIVHDAEIRELKEALDSALEQEWRLYRGRPGKLEAIAVDLVTKGPAFLKLLENERMHEVFSYFLGETCILYSFTSTILRPDETHYACEIHTDTPRLVEGYHLGIVMTLALDDFTEENGATYYLPGSHRTMAKPSEEEFYKGAVRAVRKAGDAVFMNPRIWHAGGLNRTDRVRYGCTVYACRSWMRQRFDYVRMVEPETLAQLGERGQAFLGLNVRVPTSLDQYYVSPEQRLYRPGQG